MYDDYLEKAAATYRLLADDAVFPAVFSSMADTLEQCLRGGNKVLFAGNGGSAADSQHLAGELVVKFRIERPGMAALALTVDSSVLTASLNDLGVETVFAKQVEALGKKGDILWAFSTSGESGNILAACRAAKKHGLVVFGFTGEKGGTLADLADIAFRAPSAITSHIQECHIAVGHMLCGEIERRLYGGNG
ncbi:MAG: SIS domain-containing protein [Planctomycetes bacterium]|nr:SIS domain-containing protein [Planctomycetota bacterium]